MKIKGIIGAVLIIGAVIGCIICMVVSIVFAIQNPDMTEMRRLIEYPAPTIWGVICVVSAVIGRYMLED